MNITDITSVTPAHVAGFVLTVLLFVTLMVLPRNMAAAQTTQRKRHIAFLIGSSADTTNRTNMSLISVLTAFIKRFKPRRYITLRVEFPIVLPHDFSPDEYSDTDLLRMFSDEIESKALAVYSILVNTYDVKPKRLRGTIIPVLEASSTPRNKIVIKCHVPEDAPIVLIDGHRIQMFGGDCVFFT